MEATSTASRTQVPGIQAPLGRRWSPRAFAARPVEPEKLRWLFEAARWAPSSYNAQPWAFLVATREDGEGYNRLLSTLVGVNRQWADKAPVLILAVARLDFEHVARANRHALYDLGQSVANLTVEATSQDLYIHQMAGFDARAARELFAIPPGFEPVTVLALGYLEGSSQAQAGRTRKPFADFVYSGSWGHPAPLAVEGESDRLPE